jgi:hypothetical protein
MQRESLSRIAPCTPQAPKNKTREHCFHHSPKDLGFPKRGTSGVHSASWRRSLATTPARFMKWFWIHLIHLIHLSVFFPPKKRTSSEEHKRILFPFFFFFSFFFIFLFFLFFYFFIFFFFFFFFSFFLFFFFSFFRGSIHMGFLRGEWHFLVASSTDSEVD